MALYVEHQGTMRALTSGTVSGPWPTARDVEREALERWAATNIWPCMGRLRARAEPVAVRATWRGRFAGASLVSVPGGRLVAAREEQ